MNKARKYPEEDYYELCVVGVVISLNEGVSSVVFPRLQGEAKVTGLIERVQLYMENRYRVSQPQVLCRIYMRRIDHLYYKVRSGGVLVGVALRQD